MCRYALTYTRPFLWTAESLKLDGSAGFGRIDNAKTALERENIIMAALLQAQIDIQELRAEVSSVIHPR